jgi:hypothetical protein
MSETRERYGKPSEFLDTLDGHGIYNATRLQECDFDVSFVPTFSMQQTIDAIKARGLGGNLHGDEDARVIWGYTTSAALAKQYLDHVPSGRLHGRGSGFRADLAALKEAGL